MTVQWQADMFKSAEEAKRDAITRADAGSDGWIEHYALPAIRRALRERGPEITTDDVWALVGDVVPNEPRAMGAAMTRARKAGLIVPTPEWRLSVRKECHRRPLRVWRKV
jgi:hypothetical protein